MYMIVGIFSLGGDFSWVANWGTGGMGLQGIERCFIVAGRGNR
jgi:hypothetical protein